MSPFIFILLIIYQLAESCPTSSVEKDEIDPALKEFKFDIGYGTEYFTAYVQPDIQSFSRGEHEDAKEPNMKGHAAKFINMSPDTLRLYWVPSIGEDPRPMSIIEPFAAKGTASFPGHLFMLASIDDDYNDKKTELIRFYIKDKIVFYYDPFYVPNDPELTRKRLVNLSFIDYEKYEELRRNRAFGEKYEKFTGREYISRFPRPQPRHKMWRADYFGQEHWVTSEETHFNKIPPAALEQIEVFGEHRELGDESRLLSEYRTGDEYLNMTLKVLSCAPRAFEIENFLSEAEVDHILHLADITPMSLSLTSSNDELVAKQKSTTRTSRNTWIEREKDSVIDSIYRRSANLLGIDEKLMRDRGHKESERSIGESLQLVHYDREQQYTAHHDFAYAPIEDPLQKVRFSTLLLYLNEGMGGGETEFPRWFNGNTSDGLKVTPKKGKAVLFYSMLPDGNMDDLSQHSANPITKGEKMLINLWVHDPMRKL